MPKFPRILKKGISILVTAIILLQSFLIAPKTVQAEEDLHQVFNNVGDTYNDAHNRVYLTKTITIDSITGYKDYAKINATFKIDSNDGSSTVAVNDTGGIITIGSWDPVYNEAPPSPPTTTWKPEDSDESPEGGKNENYGIYIDIGPVKEEKSGYHEGSLNYLCTADTDTEMMDDADCNYIDIVDEEDMVTIALSEYIWSDPSEIEGKGSVSIEFNALGLDTEFTTYYAQLRIEEADSSFGDIAIDSTAYSDVKTFSLDPTSTETSDEATDGGTVTTTTEGGDGVGSLVNGVQCGIRNMLGCVTHILYFFYWVSGGLLFAAGALMDIFINWSISSVFYNNDNSFINEGWKLVRDLVNIFFIIALLWIAISLVLDMGKGNAYKDIATIIIIAILINFSLFFTKVVIDAGNGLARVFYNNITISGVPENTITDESETGVEQVSLSQGVMKGMSINKLIGRDAYEKLIAGNNTLFIINSIIVLGIIVNIVVIIMFLKLALLFVGRIGQLWLSAIISPFAFASKMLPGGSSLGEFSLSGWFSTLLKASMMAPVFLFFMYLVMLLIESQFLNGFMMDQKDLSGWQIVTAILVMFMIIIGLLQKIQGITEKLAGEIASKISSGIAGAAAMVGLAAVGGAAAAGRLSVATGRNFAKAGDSARVRATTGDPSTGLRRFTNKIKDNTVGRVSQKVGADRSYRNTKAAQDLYNDGKKAEKRLDDIAKSLLNDKDAKYSKLSTADRTSVENELERKFGAANKASTMVNYGNLSAMSGREKLVAQSANTLVKGSFDVRDLASAKQWYLKTPAIMTREMIKQIGIGTGKAQADFFKDLGGAIKEGLKSAQIKVDIDTGGGTIKKKED